MLKDHTPRDLTVIQDVEVSWSRLPPSVRYQYSDRSHLPRSGPTGATLWHTAGVSGSGDAT
ncbi:hypothetical protein KEM60_03352 [Austwickia sp. TVS 96-490-7B]|nr:hypothetical protein [Austwickia sp. TVS 96-490-7B]